jgi:glycosyltransferase involved in cell wall biosynthesis
VKPDIIHAWSYINTCYAIPAKLLLKIPLISSMVTRAALIYDPWSFGKFIVNVNRIFSDYILSNTKAGIEAFNLSPKKSRVIYNGFRFERFDKKYEPDILQKKYGIISPFVIIMVASFNEFKNYDLFVEVARVVGEIRKDVTFISVGDGWDIKRISELIKSKGVENIKMLGRQNDVESIISAVDIGVLFSKENEGISNAIMEYMMLEKPVIASDSPGNDEIVEHEKTGYLIPNKNLEEIRDKIIYLIEHPEVRKKLGQNGRKKIIDCYSIEKMGKQFLDVYETFGPRNDTPSRKSQTHSLFKN